MKNKIQKQIARRYFKEIVALKNNNQNNQNNRLENLKQLNALIETILLEKFQEENICIALYSPIQKEINILSLTQLFKNRKNRKITWCLPEVVQDNVPLLFRKYHPEYLNGTTINKYTDAYKINIPTSSEYVIPNLILIPCLATQSIFIHDKIKSCRLGYGKGFYDRTLVHYDNALSVGITPFHIDDHQTHSWHIDTFDMCLDFIFQIR